MNDTTQIYDKVYFNDSYKEQFEALREHYRSRTQQALQGRKVDHAPVPNATTIVYLHDGPDGGVYVTTGDFVEYFNRRFGDNDRIGAARRSLANAARKAEICQDVSEKRNAPRSGVKALTPSRSVRPKFAFLHAVLALMLVLAIGLWTGSTLFVDQTESRLMELEDQVTMLEGGVASEGEATVLEEGVSAESTEISTYMSIGGEDQVEIYPADGVEMSGLLSIFARLFR